MIDENFLFVLQTNKCNIIPENVMADHVYYTIHLENTVVCIK